MRKRRRRRRRIVWRRTILGRQIEEKKRRKRTMEKDDLQKTQVLKTRFLHGFFHSPKLYISWKSSFKNSICYCEIEFKWLNVRYLKSFKTVLTNTHTHTHLKKITFAKVNSHTSKKNHICQSKLFCFFLSWSFHWCMQYAFFPCFLKEFVPQRVDSKDSNFQRERGREREVTTHKP